MEAIRSAIIRSSKLYAIFFIVALLVVPCIMVAHPQTQTKKAVPAAPAPAKKAVPAAPAPANKRAANRTTRREPIKPTIPGMNRYTPGKVFLEHADQLYYQEMPGTQKEEQFQVLVGNVKLRRNDMFMYCDSARFYEGTNSLDAFGNVRMQQGDTLFVYADELNYNGRSELAILYADRGKKVRLINRDVKLETDIFNYDMAHNVGFYNIGGVLTDKQNRLTSVEGEYYPHTKYAYFYTNVVLESRQTKNPLTMRTDSLIYNTATHIAELVSPTEIVNADGKIISSSGTYNTNSGVADLFSRSRIVTARGNTLTGDTLFYDRKKQYGWARGNMVLTDSARQASMHGNYGYYDEARDSAYVTGRAMAKEYSRGDTLFLHGDTIEAYLDLKDSTRVTNAWHAVRFYRSDIQGICDSLSLTQRDSMMYMYRAPVLWSGERQISGNVIMAHMADSTVDWARLPQSGLVVEHIDEDCYNQIAGKDLTAWFNDSTIRRLYVEGNVQLIMFPMENDSTYNKFAFVESSFMDAYFAGRQIESIHFWPETTSKITPLYLAKRTSYFLHNFRWLDEIRPFNKYDIFNVPETMRQLIDDAEPINFAAVDKALKAMAQPNPAAPADTETTSEEPKDKAAEPIEINLKGEKPGRPTPETSDQPARRNARERRLSKPAPATSPK